jgi:dTDP-4-dehydrorhamnose reductase
MTWLIIGRNGQLGQSLTLALTERGINFQATSSKELDIRSPEQTSTFINSVKPSVIVNAAAWTNVDEAESNSEAAFAVNALGVQNLALAAKSINAVFVQISTDYVFSGLSLKPWTVDEDCAPITAYGKTKKAGEKKALENYSEGSYVFRTAWLYSQWGKNFAKTMTRLAMNHSEEQREVKVVNNQIGQPTFANDLAEQIIDSVTSKLPFGIYHATNSGQVSWFDYAMEIFEFVNADTNRLIPIPSTEFPSKAKRPAFSVLDHEKWATTRIPVMRNWRSALADAMPSIISAIKAEE